MKIDFTEIAKKEKEALLGGEKKVEFWPAKPDDKVTVMLTELEAGGSIGMHEHVDDIEIIHMISGTGTMYIDDTKEILTPGTVHYCPLGHKHSMVNEGTVDLLYVSVLVK